MNDNNLASVAVFWGGWSKNLVKLHKVPTGLSEEELTKYILLTYAQQDAPTKIHASGQVVTSDEMFQALMEQYYDFKNRTGSFKDMIDKKWIVSYDTSVIIDDMCEYYDLLASVCVKNQWTDNLRN